MSRQLVDLQTLLRQIADEHRKLLGQMEVQHEAMKRFDAPAIADLLNQQEASRLRINHLELRRKAMTRALMQTARLTEEPTITRLAELFPPYAPELIKTRNELRLLAGAIADRGRGSTRLASSVLGHLNTAIRLLAGAVERAGVYTRQGVPRVASRIGVMDAVG
jgi:hypothetical protein